MSLCPPKTKHRTCQNEEKCWLLPSQSMTLPMMLIFSPPWSSRIYTAKCVSNLLPSLVLILITGLQAEPGNCSQVGLVGTFQCLFLMKQLSASLPACACLCWADAHHALLYRCLLMGQNAPGFLSFFWGKRWEIGNKLAQFRCPNVGVSCYFPSQGICTLPKDTTRAKSN